MKVLYQGGIDETVIKKSRFIGHSYPVRSAEEAQIIIEENKKKYWDATHNCYAYSIGDRTLKCSDDGEPSRTAGMPILDVITGRGVHDCLIIVTRYFGGTLLGTGGLVSAYSEGANLALDASEILNIEDGFFAELVCSYELYGKVNYILQQENVFVEETEFTDQVTIRAFFTADRFPKIASLVTEISSGTLSFSGKRETSFAIRQGAVVEWEKNHD